MLVNAEDMALISATAFLLASCIMLGLHSDRYCGENYCNAGENSSTDSSVSFLLLFFL